MSVAQRSSNRPLSPHLQVYRLPLLANLSILHRATGVALSVGALYLATWVMYAASNPRAYALFQTFNMSIVGRIILGGWLFSAFYHLFNGIRHLFWDAGYGFEIKDAERSAWLVIVASAVCTAIAWVVGLRLV
jgi:succinate dehydrogenase / fumarate reductase cytochrome b subunit